MGDSNGTVLRGIIESHLESQAVSDFYFAAGSRPALRSHNEVIPQGEVVLTDRHIEKFLTHDLAVDFAFKEIPCDFGVTFEGKRLRCNLDRRWQGYDLTVRLLISTIRPLKELGLPESLYQLMSSKQGLILICGPMGQGKSTTMASLLEYVNENFRKKIITAEDPLEVIFQEKSSLIHQREIRAGGSFLPYLRAAMRQRPDIIVVGEIRDSDTALTALQAAETGHLVISTMHSDSVKATLLRIRDMQEDGMRTNAMSILSTVLRAIIVQKLIKGRDGNLYVAYEICMVNNAISTLIRKDDLVRIPNQLIASQREGCVHINESLKRLMQRGLLSQEEARRYTYDPEGL